jgi:hypothetical protein
MRLFDPDNRNRNARTARLYALYELAYTAVDFAAAVQFVIGSLLFFDRATEDLGIWLFVTGSICFALRPTVHFLREIHYWRIGKVETLAGMAQE